MPTLITLSSGEKVHLKDRWTHKADKEFNRALWKGVFIEQNDATGESSRKMPAENLVLAYEAVMPYLIERIERNGSDVAFSEAWLDELDRDDYQKLKEAVDGVGRTDKASREKKG